MEWSNDLKGHNLLIRSRVQLYFYSGPCTCYIINGNFGLVKSW